MFYKNNLFPSESEINEYEEKHQLKLNTEIRNEIRKQFLNGKTWFNINFYDLNNEYKQKIISEIKERGYCIERDNDFYYSNVYYICTKEEQNKKDKYDKVQNLYLKSFAYLLIISFSIIFIGGYFEEVFKITICILIIVVILFLLILKIIEKRIWKQN